LILKGNQYLNKGASYPTAEFADVKEALDPVQTNGFNAIYISMSNRQLSSEIPVNIDQNQRFQYFIYLATQTLSSGCLASTSSGNLTIAEGKAAIEPKNEVLDSLRVFNTDNSMGKQPPLPLLIYTIS
jgi:hypothetical protein